MKIESVESFILQPPIPRFVADSFNQAITWGLPGVLIRTDEGITGTGYTSTLSHGDYAMKAIIDAGWTAVKMKVGLPDSREDHRRVAAVRKAIGDDIDLMIDVNQLWDTTTAITWAPRFEEFDIRWLEEPLDPDDVEGHARLSDSTRIPIALGEHVYSRTAFRDFITKANIGYVQADCTRLGGVTEWLAVAEIAGAYHLPVV